MQAINKPHRIAQAAKLFFSAGIGFLIVINVQPWLSLAKAIAKQIETIPLANLLGEIPILGPWVKIAIINIVPLMGTTLWAVVQVVEILPMLVDESTPAQLRQRLNSYRWCGYAIETIVCFFKYPPYEGGISSLLADFPHLDLQSINWENLVFFLVGMFGVELCAKVLITVWQGVRFIRRAN